MKKTNTDILMDNIEKWIKENNDQVSFVGSFTVFDKDGNVSDDSRMVAFGPKEVIKISLKELKKGIKNDKEDFINW